MLRPLLVGLLLTLGLTACSSAPQPPITPLTLDYTRLGPIKLAVSKVEFVNHSPLTPSPDMMLFASYQPQLGDSAYRWGVDRLQAAGTQGQAVLHITQANITRSRLPVRDDIGGWFTRSQSEKWVGQVIAELRVSGGAENFTGTATASVSRSTTIPEDATASEKENAYRRLLLGLMDDLNAQMETSMRDHLQAVMLTVP